MHPASLVDLDRYPLEELGARKGQALISACQREMASTGCCRLPGFLNPSGLSDIRHEAKGLEHRAHHSNRELTPYYREPDGSLPDDDPRALAVRFSVGYVARDSLSENGVIKSLFAWDGLLALVAATLNRGAIHRFDDSLGSLNITVMHAEEELGWHFDACEAVGSVSLESAQRGGQFEFIPPFEGSAEQNRRHVSKVLHGDWRDAVEVAMDPRDFVLFCGRHSLHRVTSIEGSRLRLMLLMSFDNVEHRETDNIGNVDLFGRASA